MGLKGRLDDDLKAALRESAGGDKTRLNTIRLLRAAVKNAEIAKGEILDDEETLTIVGREVKRRLEATESYLKAGRRDLAEQEEREEQVLRAYMPKQLDEQELDEIIAAVIKDISATTMKDIGRVMGALMPKVRGKADGRLVNNKVKALLTKEDG